MTERINTIDFRCQVEAETGDGAVTVIVARHFHRESVMNIGPVRAWVRKAYNKALREAGPNVIVSASYQGQMSLSPYTNYTGALCGVNGQTMRRDGSFEK